MSMRGLPRAATRRPGWLALALAFSVLLLTGCAGAGVPEVSSRATATATSSAERPATNRAVTPARAGRQTGAVIPEVPRSATLPSGRVVPILPVATERDGTLDVPADITVAGWWRGGSRLGDPFGSTLLSAHVDSSTQGLGPYAELLSVRAGASVVVTSKSLSQAFTVTSLELIDKGTLADHPEIFSPSGARRLTLVTCAGPYLPARGGYQRLAVVTADAVGQPTPGGG